MVCRKCGTECPDGNIFCEACGAELDAPVLPENIDERGRVKKKKENKIVESKPKKEKKIRTPENKESFKKRLKGALICLAVIAVIVIIVIIISIINANKGYNVAQQIPLGRNIEYAQLETGLEFSEKSSNGMINSMCDFDYICISDETVKVSGSEQPRWVIMLTVDDDGYISDVEYYDFSQLKLNWKGRKMSEMLDQNTLEYGMSIKNVNKKIGMKPYYIKRSVVNDSIYCYRYYYTDEINGYDRAYNYFVKFSDIELSVKDISFSEIDYAGTILAANADGYEKNMESAADEFVVDSETESDESAE